jgi:hypothetical protein
MNFSGVTSISLVHTAAYWGGLQWLDINNKFHRNGSVIMCDIYVHTATGWTFGVLRFDCRRGLGIFLFTTASRMALGPIQPPMQWVTGALSLGNKAAGS